MADDKKEWTAPLAASGKVELKGRMDGTCIHCGVPMGNFLGAMTPDGPLHNDCIPAFKRLQVERCAHCDCVLRESRTIIGGKKLHPECVNDFKAKKPFVPPRKEGMLNKFAIGRSFLGSKNWKERYFVVSKESGLAYFDDKAAFDAGKPPKNAIAMTPEVRMVTKPTRLVHEAAANPSTDIVIFFKEGGKEHKLLISCKNWPEHNEWCRVLESYIKVVDDPKDLKDS